MRNNYPMCSVTTSSANNKIWCQMLTTQSVLTECGSLGQMSAALELSLFWFTQKADRGVLFGPPTDHTNKILAVFIFKRRIIPLRRAIRQDKNGKWPYQGRSIDMSSRFLYLVESSPLAQIPYWRAGLCILIFFPRTEMSALSPIGFCVGCLDKTKSFIFLLRQQFS